ncbi:hypothetical protein I308_106657 [Cryptococcus tetragattii IND107]|uniref:F-box domain-containing protein n=1 Tax=Cryptococcus tetragattii IND107 TaxID=1296105 RepID=A0ABR3BIJ8_9TREE
MTLTPPLPCSALQPPAATFARLFPVCHIIFDQLVLEDPRQYCTLSKSTYKVAIRLLSRKLTITNNNYQKVLPGLASKSGRERLALIHFEHLTLATTNLELLKALQLETDYPVFTRVSQLEFVEKFPWSRLGHIHHELGRENIEDILARHIPAKVFIINIRNPITQGYGYGPALDRISMLLAAFVRARGSCCSQGLPVVFELCIRCKHNVAGWSERRAKAEIQTPRTDQMDDIVLRKRVRYRLRLLKCMFRYPLHCDVHFLSPPPCRSDPTSIASAASRYMVVGKLVLKCVSDFLSRLVIP